MAEDTFQDFVAIQCQGARRDAVGPEAGRRGGAGPSDDKAFLVGGHTLMIPTLNRAARSSPFTIVQGEDGLRLESAGRVIGPVTAVPRPRFYDLHTADGIAYEKLARLHGSDCLATTVIQECCRYDDPATRCRFCAIGVSLDEATTVHTKTPDQLAEVARAAQALDGVTHVTLTSGTLDQPDRGALYLGECAHAIQRATGLPIELQFEPPEDPAVFSALARLGVGDIGMHVESFDEAVRHRVTPGKATVSVEQYFASFAEAVRVFGRGRVSTYVILGLGEDEAITLEGCRRAAEMGVYPFVVPLRPMANTFLAKALPPAPEYMLRMYSAVAALLRRHGLSSRQSGAGCVKCRACSLLHLQE